MWRIISVAVQGGILRESSKGPKLLYKVVAAYLGMSNHSQRRRERHSKVKHVVELLDRGFGRVMSVKKTSLELRQAQKKLRQKSH